MPKNDNIIICHYAEVGLKGKNRKFFEEKLVENIRHALPKGSFKNVKRISGRILIEINRQGVQGAKLPASRELSSLQNILRNVFGIAYFAFAFKAEQNIEAIKQKALEILQSRNFETFRVDAKRSNKNFPLTSQQINEQVGVYVLEGSLAPFLKGAKLPSGPRVDLENPDITLFIQIVEEFAFLFTKKVKGQGGLPVGVSSKAISLLSGGIDSPVSSFLAMKRGVEIIFCHFHAVPYVSKESVDKVKQIAHALSRYQGKSKLYLVPFGDIQKEILLKTKPDLRVILYRRLMFKIAEEIAKKEKAKALVTGESIGQVASQTIENISVISEAVSLPVLRPLIGQDKEEIIKKAKEIGTYEFSIIPHQDCCSRFLPKHPATKADLDKVKKEETKLDVEELVKEGIKNAKIEQISP